MSGALSIGGIISGMNTDNILVQLEQIARTPITRMQQEQSDLRAKSDAWNQLNTYLLSIKDKAQALTKLSEKIGVTATTSTKDGITVSSNSSASAGDYSFTVKQLSTYHQFTSQSFTDQDVTGVGHGALTITIGEKTTTIDSPNLTLAGLRDAINANQSGVKAMIITESPTSYRLMVTSQTQGEAGEITLGSTLAGTGALVLTESQSAQDTIVQFGTGESAITVQRSGNTLKDVIPGVTMNLSSGIEDTAVTLHLAQSTTGVKQAITDFMNQYNAFQNFIGLQNTFDQDTGESGTLFGEQQMQQIVSELSAKLFVPVESLPSEMNSFTQLGLSVDADGKLTLDTAMLDTALTDNLEGVYRLFNASGVSQSQGVSYVYSTSDTKPSGSAGYAIHVDTPATQSKSTVPIVLSATLTADETLTLNGIDIALTNGMTQMQMLAAINAKSETTGVIASLTTDGGTGDTQLTFTRRDYGAGLHIEVKSSLETGGLGIGTTTRNEAYFGGVSGQDIVGTINGEAATGSGQLLTSSSGASKGLQVLVNATAAGDFSPLVFTRGVGSIFAEYLDFITDTDSNGSIASAQKSLTERIDALSDHITDTEDSIALEMGRMRKQFNAMEVALSKLQNQSAQLASLISQMSSTSSSMNQQSS